MVSGKLQLALEDIRLYGYHGVDPQEHAVGANYRLDIALNLAEIPAGCFTDEVRDTVNYAEVYGVIKSEFAKPSRLIEHVASRIVNAVMQRFSEVQSVELKLIKENPPIPGFSGHAAVQIFFEK